MWLCGTGTVLGVGGLMCVWHSAVGSAGGMGGYWVRATLRNSQHCEGVVLLEIENNDIYREEEHS